MYIHNDDAAHYNQPGLFDTSNQWFAKVLEVRAQDEFHVYLRVFWLYRHFDLPLKAQAETPYHGEHELIPSNDMDIVDAMTVNGKVAELKHFNDYDDDEGSTDNTWYQDVFWRQTYNVTTKKLSSLRRYCICKQPTNPDNILVRCSNQNCAKWLHAKCIEDDVIKRTHEQASLDGDATVVPTLEPKSASNGDVASSTVSSMLSGSIKAITARLKTPSKITETPGKAEIESIASNPSENLSVIEAAVFKKKNDGAKQSHCLVKVTKRNLDTGEEFDSEQEIECLFCGKQIM